MKYSILDLMIAAERVEWSTRIIPHDRDTMFLFSHLEEPTVARCVREDIEMQLDEADEVDAPSRDYHHIDGECMKSGLEGDYYAMFLIE